MYIKQLIIKETKPVDKIIREVPFQLGLNFIVDAGVDQEKGNSVGKTTILRLIDIALGAKDRKYIYYDDETRKTNTDLKNYIEENRLKVEMLIADSFDEDKETQKYVLGADLFPNGKRYIDNEVYNQNDYWEHLNRIFFSNKENFPTFRQLIHMFVRIDQRSDNNKFLKFLTRTNDDTYENIYDYLFELQEQGVSSKLLKIKQEISSKEKELKSYMKMNNFNSVDILHQKVVLLEKNIQKINADMDVLIESKKFKENEEKISEIKIEYAQYKSSLDDLFFRKNKIKSILNDAKQDKSNLVDEDVLKALYSETLSLVGKLTKEFDDLLKFNEELVKNKINYFNQQLERTEEKIKLLEIKKNELFENHKNIIMLIEENKIDEYTQLNNLLAEYSEELGKNKNIIQTYTNIEDRLSELRDELSSLDQEKSEQFNSIELFNEYFSKFSEKTNGEPFMLYKTKEGFPFGIDYVKKGLSTGTRKSIITAFDLAYQKLAFKLDKKVPHFIVHDVIETIDQVALSAIAEIVNSMEVQYIVAVLKEKIEKNDLITKDDVAVTLSETNRPFKM